MTKLAITALLALTIGAAGTYAAIHITATCSAPALSVSTDNGMKKFLSGPNAPLTGYPTYK
jgi:hypothetical protein